MYFEEFSSIPAVSNMSGKLADASIGAGGCNDHIGGCEQELGDFWTTQRRVHDVGYVGGLRSQLKPEFWIYELSKETDVQLSEYLGNGVLRGFTIVDSDANVPGYFCPNYQSVLQGESSDDIDKLIVSELIQDKFVLSDYKPACVHALGAVRKKSGSFRPITDCKRPLTRSINNYMNTTYQPFKYHSSDSVCELMKPSCYMATVDIASAYRSVHINPDDWDYQGIAWQIEGETRYLYDTRLCFGLRCAPLIFTKIAEFVSNCMSRKGFSIVYYIDDFWISGDSFEACQGAQIELIVLLGRLGFCVSWNKCSSPSQTCTYLGLSFNSVDMTISLPNEKIQALHRELKFFHNKKRTTKKQIMRLAGVLSHCARVVRGGRTFSRRILDLLRGLKDGNPRLYLNEHFRLDLQWWCNCSSIFNGICPIIKYNYGESNHICSDASFNGYGVTYGQDWIAGYYNTSVFPADVSLLSHDHHWCNVYVQHDENINILELVPILIAARYFGSNWVNTHIVCFSDNTQVVAAINKGVCLNKVSMSILRELFWLSVKFNFHLTARYLPGRLNVVNDMLSRISVSNHVMSNIFCSLCCRGHIV